jgi:hypothetical protein
MESRRITLRADAVVEWYFCACMILPSGSIFGINVKQPLFLLAWLTVLSRPARFRFTKQVACNALALAAVLFSWVVLAFFTGRSEGLLPLMQFEDIVVTAATAFLVIEYIRDSQRCERFIRLVIYCVGLTAAVKAASFAYALASGSSVSVVVNALSDVFGVNLATLENGNVGARFQFVSDSVIPVALYGLLSRKNRFGISSAASSLLVALLSFSAVVTFSRFLWAFSAVGLMLGIATSRVDRMKVVYFAFVGLAVAYLWNELVLLYELRTSAVQVDFSDGLRHEQQVALYKFVMDAPVFGHGLGTFTAEIVRHPVLFYSYELQLVALVGQVGIVGTAFLMASIAYYYRGIFDHRRPVMHSMCVLLLIVVWISSGFTNPYLSTSSAGLVFGLLYALAPRIESYRRPEVEIRSS